MILAFPVSGCKVRIMRRAAAVAFAPFYLVGLSAAALVTVGLLVGRAVREGWGDALGSPWPALGAGLAAVAVIVWLVI